MINYFSEDIDFRLDHEEVISSWLVDLATHENKDIHIINYIFCTDEYLHKINIDYLSHDTLTDIITFDNSSEDNQIEADIFISIERVKENALTFHGAFNSELHRVMSHGLLHLLGYKDKTDEEKKLMREKEEACLSLLQI